MALNFHRQLNGLQLVPQNTIIPSVLGEIRYNSTSNKLELFNGSLDPIVTESSPSVLTPISNDRILSNISGSTALPVSNTLTSIFDSILSSNQGDIIYRDASSWVTLPPGTSGQVLSTGGSSANPSWISAAGTGTVTQVNTGTGLTGGPITTTGTISLSNTTVTAGPYTNANITVDAQGRITLASNGTSTPTGTANTVAFFNGSGNLSSQNDFHWDTTHLGIIQTNPKARIHADSTTTSGTVGTGAMILGRVHTTRNIGTGSALFGSQTGGAGISNSCEAEDSLVAGRSNVILNGTGLITGSFIIGQNNNITTSGLSVIFGGGNTITGNSGFGTEGCFITGGNNTISYSAGGGRSAILGDTNQITDADAAFAANFSNIITGKYASGFGQENLAQGYAQIVGGRFNIAQGTTSSWVATDDLFILGNGTSSGSRANAFKVTKDGRTVAKRMVYDPTSTVTTVAAGNTIDTSTLSFIKIQSTTGAITLGSPSISNGQTDGQITVILNVGTDNITIQNTSSVKNPAATSFILTPNSTISYIWGTATTSWYCTSSSIN